MDWAATMNWAAQVAEEISEFPAVEESVIVSQILREVANETLEDYQETFEHENLDTESHNEIAQEIWRILKYNANHPTPLLLGDSWLDTPEKVTALTSAVKSGRINQEWVRKSLGDPWKDARQSWKVKQDAPAKSDDKVDVEESSRPKSKSKSKSKSNSKSKAERAAEHKPPQ